MMRITLVIILLSYLSCFGQTNKTKSLLVAEFEKDCKGVKNCTHLVKYSFLDGIFLSKDTIFSDLSNQTVVYGSSDFLLKNRYVITSSGSIIDINEKTLLLEGYNRFIDTVGSNILFYKGNNYTPEGYWVYDLEKRTYEFILDSNFYSLNGIYSPDRQWAIEIIEGRKSIINRYNRKIVKVFNKSIRLNPLSSTRRNIPALWIDNKNVLYAYNSTVNNIEIVKYNLDSNTDSLIVTIDSVPADHVNARFYFNPNKKIVFQCAKGLIEIDLNDHSYSLNLYSSLGNNFEIEYKMNNDYGRVLKYQGTEIGKFWCNNNTAIATQGYIIVEYGEIGSNLGYPDGIKVWNDITKAWIEIEIPWISSIISWLK